MIEFVEGDLFRQGDVQALGHGVNCKGVMGAGIAPLFKKRFPAMYIQYRDLCDRGTLTPGLVFPYMTNVYTRRWVYNMATQDSPGADATYAWLDSTLRAVRLHAEVNNVPSVALPRIGAGIGGLDWLDVKATMSKVFKDSPVMLRVVSLPGAGD